jgi:hypothetical protein
MDQDGELIVDDVGTDLDSVEAAGLEATRAMAEYAKDRLVAVRPQLFRMFVRDQAGSSLFELELSFKATRLAGR